MENLGYSLLYLILQQKIDLSELIYILKNNILGTLLENQFLNLKCPIAFVHSVFLNQCLAIISLRQRTL